MPDERATRRASDAPAEEQRMPSHDRTAQADAILAESEERQEGREESGGTVEHRKPTHDR